MAKLSAHGTELFRYFSARYRALISVRSDGITLYRTPFAGWKVLSRKKKDVSLKEWKETKYKAYGKLQPWKQEVRELPSIKQVEAWSLDSVCETTDGNECEPDYRGPGAPSWLVALGLV